MIHRPPAILLAACGIVGVGVLVFTVNHRLSDIPTSGDVLGENSTGGSGTTGGTAGTEGDTPPGGLCGPKTTTKTGKSNNTKPKCECANKESGETLKANLHEIVKKQMNAACTYAVKTDCGQGCKQDGEPTVVNLIGPVYDDDIERGSSKCSGKDRYCYTSWSWSCDHEQKCKVDEVAPRVKCCLNGTKKSCAEDCKEGEEIPISGGKECSVDNCDKVVPPPPLDPIKCCKILESNLKYKYSCVETCLGIPMGTTDGKACVPENCKEKDPPPSKPEVCCSTDTTPPYSYSCASNCVGGKEIPTTPAGAVCSTQSCKAPPPPPPPQQPEVCCKTGTASSYSYGCAKTCAGTTIPTTPAGAVCSTQSCKAPPTPPPPPKPTCVAPELGKQCKYQSIGCASGCVCLDSNGRPVTGIGNRTGTCEPKK